MCKGTKVWPSEAVSGVREVGVDDVGEMKLSRRLGRSRGSHILL